MAGKDVEFDHRPPRLNGQQSGAHMDRQLEEKASNPHGEQRLVRLRPVYLIRQTLGQDVLMEEQWVCMLTMEFGAAHLWVCQLKEGLKDLHRYPGLLLRFQPGTFVGQDRRRLRRLLHLGHRVHLRQMQSQRQAVWLLHQRFRRFRSM